MKEERVWGDYSLIIEKYAESIPSEESGQAQFFAVGAGECLRPGHAAIHRVDCDTGPRGSARFGEAVEGAEEVAQIPRRRQSDEARPEQQPQAQ